MIKIFLLLITLLPDLHASDGTPAYEIWLDLGITQEEYYYLSGMAGLVTGFIFSLSIILILTKR